MTRKHFAVTIGIGLSAVFLWLAVRDLELDELLRSLAATNLVWTIPFVAALAAFCWLKSVRWAVLLHPVSQVSARQLVAPVVIGYMGTGLMPMQLGEVARAYLAARRTRARLAPVLATLVVERILDVMSLLVIVGLIAVSSGELAVQYQVAGLLFLAIAAATSVLVWAYGAYTHRFVEFLRRNTTVLPPKWQQHLLDHVSAGAAGVQVLRRPGTYLGLIALSLAQWACMSLCIWMSLAAVGEFISPVAALTVLATTILAMTLPAGPGYIGTLQLAFVLALAPFGIERSVALAASIFYLAALWIPLVVGGIVLLHRMGMGLSDLRNQELRAESP